MVSKKIQHSKNPRQRRAKTGRVAAVEKKILLFFPFLLVCVCVVTVLLVLSLSLLSLLSLLSPHSYFLSFSVLHLPQPIKRGKGSCV